MRALIRLGWRRARRRAASPPCPPLLAQAAASPRRLGARAPGSPAYVARDAQNIRDAYGRVIGPGGQLQNPAYLTSLTLAGHRRPDLAADGAGRLPHPRGGDPRPGRARAGTSATPCGWAGTAPAASASGSPSPTATAPCCTAPSTGRSPGARDPYTGAVLTGPFPGVVITEGSVQGSEGMYRWLAEDLAERGYVVLTYDVQGQGGGETLPTRAGARRDQQRAALLQPVRDPPGRRAARLPRHPGPAAVELRRRHRGRLVVLHLHAGARTTPTRAPRARRSTAYNPYWQLFDHSPDPHPTAPGRTTRIAIIGHSMGAAAVSKVQTTDRGSRRWWRSTSSPVPAAPARSTAPATSPSSRRWRCSRSTASR